VVVIINCADTKDRIPRSSL